MLSKSFPQIEVQKILERGIRAGLHFMFKSYGTFENNATNFTQFNLTQMALKYFIDLEVMLIISNARMINYCT